MTVNRYTRATCHHVVEGQQPGHARVTRDTPALSGASRHVCHAARSVSVFLHVGCAAELCARWLALAALPMFNTCAQVLDYIYMFYSYDLVHALGLSCQAEMKILPSLGQSPDEREGATLTASTHTHTHADTHMQTHTHTHTYIYTYTHTHARTRTHTHARARAHTHARTRRVTDTRARARTDLWEQIHAHSSKDTRSTGALNTGA